MIRNNPKKQSPRLLFQVNHGTARCVPRSLLSAEMPRLSESTYVSLHEGHRERRLGGLTPILLGLEDRWHYYFTQPLRISKCPCSWRINPGVLIWPHYSSRAGRKADPRKCAGKIYKHTNMPEAHMVSGIRNGH